MQDLHHDLAVFFMHGAGQTLVVVNIADAVHGAAERQQPTLPARRNTARHDQPDTALGARPEIFRQLGIVKEAIF